MSISHIISTTDPINGFEITDLIHSPSIVDGSDNNDLTIYFESAASRQVYLDLAVEHPEQDFSKTLSNPSDDYSG